MVCVRPLIFFPGFVGRTVPLLNAPSLRDPSFFSTFNARKFLLVGGGGALFLAGERRPEGDGGERESLGYYNARATASPRGRSDLSGNEQSLLRVAKINAGAEISRKQKTLMSTARIEGKNNHGGPWAQEKTTAQSPPTSSPTQFQSPFVFDRKATT